MQTGIQTSVMLNANFSEASAASVRSSILSSLRPDAEMHVSELASERNLATPTADSMLNKAFDLVKENAKSEGRRPKRSEIQAALHSIKSDAKQGFHL